MSQSILLVDDDEGLRALNGIILQQAGFTVYQARDGYKALKLLEKTIPDLFILDVMMPEMTGFELCQRLRAWSATCEHPIMLLSARTDQASIAEGLKSGANLYVTKPVDYDDLISQIGELLKQASATT